MTGEELAWLVIRGRPGPPVILCTGYSESMTAQKAMDLGLKAFLMNRWSWRPWPRGAVRSVLDETHQGHC